MDIVSEDGFCVYEDCGHTIVSLRYGYCSAHYQQFRTGGIESLKPRSRTYNPQQERTSDTCTFEGCDRPYSSKGYCHTHYGQFKKYGASGMKPIRRSMKAAPGDAKECSFESCTKEREQWGYCVGHSRQLEAGKKTLVPLRVRFYRCGVPGCGSSKDLQWGMCGKHYGRFRRYGINVIQAGLIQIDERPCDICGNLAPLHVDHDHSCCDTDSGGYTCGKCTRGFLCAPCNYGLGNFRDDVAILHAAEGYLLNSASPVG